MLKFIKSLFFEDVQFLGIRDKDIPPAIEFEEVVAKSSEPEWKEKPMELWRSFLAQYQSTSSACVAFTLAKLTQILNWLNTGKKIKFSPGYIYKRRTPKGEGMHIDNAIKLASEGMITEELYPSEGLSEDQINNLPDQGYADRVADGFAISPNWVNLPLDFDTVASTIQKTGKGIMVWFRFGKGEWFKNRFPKVLNAKKIFAHSITAVDSFKWKGTEYILCEDSAEKSDQQKLISREVFNNMVYLARYPLNFKFDSITNVKPKYDGSTVSLQNCLKYEGLFPSNVDSTGIYGKITTDAVGKFQLKHGFEVTGQVGPKTRAKLLELYN